MIRKSRILVDHGEIRRWAKERGAKPSLVRRTHEDDSIGIIGFEFPGASGGDSPDEISWDEWFRDFDEDDLALIVGGEMANGESSNFHKLVARENLDSWSETYTPGGENKASSRPRISARSPQTGGQGSGKTAVRSKPITEGDNQEQHSKCNTSGHKPRRKAA